MVQQFPHYPLIVMAINILYDLMLLLTPFLRFWGCLIPGKLSHQADENTP